MGRSLRQMALTPGEVPRPERALAAPVAALLRGWPLGLPVLLGGAVIWLTFESGGYFAGQTAIAVIVAGLLLLLWMMLMPRPFDALSAPLVAAAGSLALFAGWALLSQRWSEAPARAVIESNRTLLYLLVVVLFGLGGLLPLVRENVVRLAAVGFVVVSIVGLITRLLPELWPISDSFEFKRLSYPISYWNAQGMLAALGVLTALHVAATGGERRAVRALAAAAIPIACCALLLTFSRGAIAALIVGVVVYVCLARPARIASALAGIVPATAAALVVTYQASTVVNAINVDADVVSQGKSVALVIVGCAVASGALLWLLSPLDDIVAGMRRPTVIQRSLLIAVLVAVVGVGAAAAKVPQHVSDTVDRFGRVEQPTAESTDNRSHLTSISDSGRADQYRVAWRTFKDHELIGTGAGTYPLSWSQRRTTVQTVNDGHSLYLETMSEMGLVGLALLLGAIGSLLVGCLLRRRTHRALGSIGFALTLMWALRAGIDWDWEMPALTLPVLAIAGATLHSPREEWVEARRSWPNGIPRLLVGLALLGGLITPWAIVRSQSHLNDAVADLRAGRCTQAIPSALASSDALSVRPEPFEILAICDLRAQQRELALRAFNAAVRRDPDNWRLLYDLAIARAALGQDPRPGINDAIRRNPRSAFLEEAKLRFSTRSSAEWRRRAARSILLE